MEEEYSMLNEKLLEMRQRVKIAESMKQKASVKSKHWKAILVCYFPRDTTEKDLAEKFGVYAEVESVFLVVKKGVSKCFGFMNFTTHEGALAALAATEAGNVAFTDSRGVRWQVKGEWADGNGSGRDAKDKNRKAKTGKQVRPLSLESDASTAEGPSSTGSLDASNEEEGALFHDLAALQAVLANRAK
jgi:RNA recognition motif-containing protein